ncbi:TIR domain-containing protein [Methylomonas albis]|uniref:TIR domain-containing protein n=1 Tax=Methylomonas albis TaxID=1854563 RepID=A0ABR9D6F2_9GAMM|nr:TIR domain-containing protein [Methylomonas albis]MBD9358696.1 TIR domain-containing protein [Methylomonas albis]
MDIYSVSEVFNESEIPVLTFVEPKEFRDIVGSLVTSGKHVTLSGPSGCGKTTLAKKSLDEAGFGPGNTHWISGRDHSNAHSASELFSKEFSCEENEILICLQAAGIVVVDDFHHLHDDVRNEIGYKLKRWHEQGVRFLVIGIASSSKKMLDIDSELGIRNDVYEMKRQSDDFCEKVISLGEKHLYIKISEDSRAQFVRASDGIPSAIQVICRVACIRNNVLKTQNELIEISCQMNEIKDGVLRIYKGKYHNKLVGLCKGKQQARSVHNTYFDIIKIIAIIGKGEIHFQEIQQRLLAPIEDAKEKAKKTTSFHNCIKYLPSVIEERGLDDAVYVNRNSESISIEDPSFGLYLSLIDLDEIGQSIKLRRTGYPWDVAVSFAGEDRAIVEEFKDILNESGYTVFYDFDVQHQLWGTDLRIKLADVYANDAQYMVIFLSNHYPEKDWTNFEFEIGKEAKGKRTETYLLPVKLDDVSVVGLSSNVGYIDLRRCSPSDLANSLIEKIEHS